jgi:hypothetical protein
MMLALLKNGIRTSRFVPCAASRSLLKTLAVAEKRAVAQGALLYSTGGLRGIDLGFRQATSQWLQTQTDKHGEFNPPRGFERRNFVAKNSTIQPQHERTQLAPNQ